MPHPAHLGFHDPLIPRVGLSTLKQLVVIMERLPLWWFSGEEVVAGGDKNGVDRTHMVCKYPLTNGAPTVLSIGSRLQHKPRILSP